MGLWSRGSSQQLAGLACSGALLVGCGLFGGGPAGEELVEDVDVLAFANRIEAFYRALEAVPLGARITYDDPELREHFRDGPAFADYYASLAHQVRAASFRNGRAARIEISEFRFDGPELALVDVRIVGHHQRRLRFWEIHVARTDVWRRLEGTWVLAPEKL